MISAGNIQIHKAHLNYHQPYASLYNTWME